MISPPYNINMSKLVISEEARSEQLADLAIAINEIVRLPVTMRGRNTLVSGWRMARWWMGNIPVRSWKRP